MPTPDEFSGLPPTCELRNWLIFGPGYYKGDLYTPAMCGQMAANFARLSTGPTPYLVPRVKIGHDAGQRLAESLGFPSYGRVARLDCDGQGQIRLWCDQIPTALGGAINAGLFRNGSIEIPPPMPDPSNPAVKIQGPVLTAVSLLGEEQPAVKGYPPPKAVFADGTLVPPAKDLTPWLNAMAEVAKAFSAGYRPKPKFRFRGSEYETKVLCYSDFTEAPTVDLNALIEAYKALPPDQQQQFMQACQGMAAPPASGAAMGDDAPPPPAGPPDDIASLKKQMADMQAAVSGMQADKQNQDMAMYSDRVETAVDDAIRRGAIDRRDRETFINDGKTRDRTKKYSDGDHKGKTAADVWLAGIAARQGNPMYREEPELVGSDPLADRTVVQTLQHKPWGRKILDQKK